MHPLEYTGLIDAANSNQRQDFLSFAGNAHRSSLNTGLFNFLRDEQGQTDCTDGYAIFSGRGQNARSDKGGVFRADAETSNYNAGMNFWSCALFPNVTSALLDDGLSLQNETFLPDHYAQPVAGTSATVVSFLSVCLSSWCGESSDCNASSCAMEQLTIGDSMLSAASVDTCLDHLCSLSAKKRSNPDIAGIGVIISYFIQYAFTAAGLCGLLVCAILIRWNIRRTKSQSGRDCPDEKSDSSSSLPIVLSVKETLVMALDDFQRAQCSFAIAINIASLVTLQLRSHAISYVDRRAMIAGSASGTLSTCLVLAALMESNKRHSKFTFWLTFTTWAISLSVGLHPQIFKYRDSTSDYLTKYPPVCGKSPPVNVCGGEPDVFRNASTMLLIAIATMLALTGWQLQPALRRFRKQPLDTDPRLSRVRFLMCPLVGITGIAYLFFITYVRQIIKEKDWEVDWSFGQVVAICSWLPTVFMLAKCFFHGPCQDHTDQMPETLGVTRVSDREHLPEYGFMRSNIRQEGGGTPLLAQGHGTSFSGRTLTVDSSAAGSSTDLGSV